MGDYFKQQSPVAVERIRERIISAGGSGALGRIVTVDPGESVAASRLADPATGAISPECAKGASSMVSREIKLRELQIAGKCEIREDSGKSRLQVTASTGRASSVRYCAELFAPGSMQWGAEWNRYQDRPRQPGGSEINAGSSPGWKNTSQRYRYG